jgi:hypothetical protein
MNEVEINAHIGKKGLLKADIVRDFQKQNPHLSENYANTLIRGIISGSRWSDDAVNWLRNNYGITPDKPVSAMNKRERLRLQAA